MNITVLIADRNKTTRLSCLEALKPEKGIAIAAAARNGLEAISSAEALKPRILILNLNLFKGKRNSLLRALRQKSPRTRIILLTRRAREDLILDMLSEGARGYLKETAIPAFLPKAGRLVEEGEAWAPRKMVGKILDRLVARRPASKEEEGPAGARPESQFSSS